MELDVLQLPTAKIKQLNDKGIHSVEELVRFVPKTYYDFRNPVSLKESINSEFPVLLKGKIISVRCVNSPSKKYINVSVIDSVSGLRFFVTWFNQMFLLKNIAEGEEYFFGGKVSYNEEHDSYSITAPVLFSSVSEFTPCMYPVYSVIRGMAPSYLQSLMKNAISLYKSDEFENLERRKKYGIVSEMEMIKFFHCPQSPEEIAKAKRRLVYEEVFRFVYGVKKFSPSCVKSPFTAPNKSLMQRYISSLPYSLTSGQKEAIEGIYKNIVAGNRVNALVQGDVGCGKTTVIFALMCLMAGNGIQSCVMAPTSVLANQHFLELKAVGDRLGISVVYLSGDLKAKEKKEALCKIKSGEALLIVGTHSVISDSVEYKNLGLYVVDEEHRFGVLQKEQMKKKAEEGVHSIMMSATPIPRSLAIATQGSVQVYSITTLPAGRKPVLTGFTNQDSEVFRVMDREIKNGHQCYVVCPMIDSNPKLEIESVQKAEALMKKHFEPMGVKVGVINGHLKPEEIAAEIEKFKNMEMQVIISTTIIEVGVNVPNATVIVIRNADRFGLSQLHQLRGRVGRGNDQGYCILNAEERTERLSVLCSTNDGFKIAEADLKLRGSGDFVGTSQSGENRGLMLVLAYPSLYNNLKADIDAIYLDPDAREHYDDWFINSFSVLYNKLRKKDEKNLLSL